MRVIWAMVKRKTFYVSEFSSSDINLDFFKDIRGLIIIRVEQKKLYKAIKSIESSGYRFTLRY
jgi:hypothetical protein